MARLALLGIAVIFGILLARLIFPSSSSKEPNPTEMVQDPNNGVYIPKSEAIKKIVNGKDYYFFGGGYIWSELEPMDFLTDLLEKFCTVQNLPFICADELLNSRNYDRHVNNSYVKGWLESFGEFWDFEQEWNDTTNDRS